MDQAGSHVRSPVTKERGTEIAWGNWEERDRNQEARAVASPTFAFGVLQFALTRDLGV